MYMYTTHFVMSVCCAQRIPFFTIFNGQIRKAIFFTIEIVVSLFNGFLENLFVYLVITL